MNSILKKISTIILTIVMIASFLPLSAGNAYADTIITDPDGSYLTDGITYRLTLAPYSSSEPEANVRYFNISTNLNKISQVRVIVDNVKDAEDESITYGTVITELGYYKDNNPNEFVKIKINNYDTYDSDIVPGGYWNSAYAHFDKNIVPVLKIYTKSSHTMNAEVKLDIYEDESDSVEDAVPIQVGETYTGNLPDHDRVSEIGGVTRKGRDRDYYVLKTGAQAIYKFNYSYEKIEQTIHGSGSKVGRTTSFFAGRDAYMFTHSRNDETFDNSSKEKGSAVALTNVLCSSKDGMFIKLDSNSTYIFYVHGGNMKYSFSFQQADISEIIAAGGTNTYYLNLGIYDDHEYEGKPITTDTKITMEEAYVGNGSRYTLLEGTDYKVTYKDNDKPGTATKTITGLGEIIGSVSKTFLITGEAGEEITSEKAANPLAVKAKSPSVKYSKLKKKTQTLGVSKVLKFTNAGQGTKTYTKSSGNKKITINKKTGKVTIKKGLKKGTYTIKIKVKAAGNDKYKAATKTVKVKIKVK